MRALIRHITQKSRAGVGHADREVEADTLTIGRGSDAEIFLSDLHVALRHAILRRVSSGKFTVQARTPSGVKINGRTTQTGIVRPGDTLGVGLSTLRLQSGGGQHDVVIEIDEARSRAGEKADSGPTSLREAGLGKRRWAWALFLVFLAIGLGLPVAEITLRPSSDDPDAAPGGAAGPIAGLTRWLPAGGDRVWDSGPMSEPHRSFGDDCGACHRRPFQRVTDAACLDCHEGQPHHADDAGLMRTAGLSDRRCASCHLEHSGTEALRGTDAALCADCHAAPGRNMPESALQAVSGFGDDRHPQFRVRLVSIGDDGPAWERIRMDGPVNEDSGLFFPHDKHLDPDGVQAPDGKEQLACADCHRPGPAGVTMQPVRFERDCQRCHQLNFEPEDPDRELPHGKPGVVLDMLEEYYARVALAGGYERPDPEVDPPDVVRRERPAGDTLEEGGRRAALAWAREQAKVVATEMFEYRACRTCHEVTRAPDQPAGWRVRPVALTQQWFPEADFTHARHEQMACTDCHEAEDSEASTDVLMPGIGNCRECHGGQDSREQIASTCADCHGFHEADELEMGTSDAQIAHEQR